MPVLADGTFHNQVGGLKKSDSKIPGRNTLHTVIFSFNECPLEQLADLKINPREQEINKYLIARGERLYEEATGTRRERIERELIRFDSALNMQDKREIELAGRELKEFLDKIDDESDVEDRDE